MSIVLAVGALGALVVALRLLATVAAHLVEQASPPSWDERLPTHDAYERAVGAASVGRTTDRSDARTGTAPSNRS